MSLCSLYCHDRACQSLTRGWGIPNPPYNRHYYEIYYYYLLDIQRLTRAELQNSKKKYTGTPLPLHSIVLLWLVLYLLYQGQIGIIRLH